MKDKILALLDLFRSKLADIRELDPDIEGDKVFTMIVLAEDLVVALSRAYEEAVDLETLINEQN